MCYKHEGEKIYGLFDSVEWLSNNPLPRESQWPGGKEREKKDSKAFDIFFEYIFAKVQLPRQEKDVRDPFHWSLNSECVGSSPILVEDYLVPNWHN